MISDAHTYSNRQQAKDELHRLVGRNLLEFQRFEQMIKWMIVENGLGGEISELETIRANRTEVIAKQTLGQLVPQFMDAISSEKESESVTKLKGFCISTEFTLLADKKVLEQKRERLAVTLNARNDFIHHLFMEIDRSTIEGCVLAIKDQEALYKEITVACESLATLVKSFADSRKRIAAFLASDTGREQFIRSTLIHQAQSLLESITAESSRPDGWTLLSIAGSEVITQSPNLMADLCCDSLKELILACEVFELRSEVAGKGYRILFRKKHDTNT